MSKSPTNKPGKTLLKKENPTVGSAAVNPLPQKSRSVSSELPTIAIVGRPNVGKSTLFNRLCGGHHAIVNDEPGVTRDRRYGESDYHGVTFRVVDTGGLDLSSDDPKVVTTQIVRQSMLAIDEADLLLFVIDAKDGLLPDDRDIAVRLRQTKKPILYVANKVDGYKDEPGVAEGYSLGAQHVFGISASHGRGLPDLLEAIVSSLPKSSNASNQTEDGDQVLKKRDSLQSSRRKNGASALVPEGESSGVSDQEHQSPGLSSSIDENDEQGAQDHPIQDDIIRIALVGRPNAGKSSLINQLIGEERMIVHDQPGTTRDPVDTLIEHQGQRYLLIDTAGIRRRARVHEPMEKIAVAMAEKAVNRADVVLLVIDAKSGIGEQDAKIAGLVQEAGKALMIVFNKQDLIDSSQKKRIQQERERILHFVPWAKEVFCSAHNRHGIMKLLTESRRVYASFIRRVSTGALNRFFEGIVERHPPPLYQGHPIRLYYITQAQTKPPTFVISVNHPQGMHFSYERYLQNQIRDTFGFEGTPIRILARQRSGRS